MPIPAAWAATATYSCPFSRTWGPERRVPGHLDHQVPQAGSMMWKL